MKVRKLEGIEVEFEGKTYSGYDAESVACEIVADSENIHNPLWDSLNASCDITSKQFNEIKGRDFAKFMDEMEQLVELWREGVDHFTGQIKASLK